MQNLKIKVNSQAESKEAQELFFEFGFKGFNGGKNINLSESIIMVRACGEYGVNFIDSEKTFDYMRYVAVEDEYKEITLPQLRDMVVLHRNDVRDATHTSEARLKWFVSSDYKIYSYHTNKWVFISDDKADLQDLILIKKDKDMENLISGVEALSKVHTGNVQYVCLTNPVKDQWTTITDHFWDQYSLGVFLNKDTTWRFRLKPRTIKIGDIEVPAPFEPKDGG